MAKLEQRRYNNKPQKHEFLGLITVRKWLGKPRTSVVYCAIFKNSLKRNSSDTFEGD